MLRTGSISQKLKTTKTGKKKLKYVARTSNRKSSFSESFFWKQVVRWSAPQSFVFWKRQSKSCSTKMGQTTTKETLWSKKEAYGHMEFKVLKPSSSWIGLVNWIRILQLNTKMQIIPNNLFAPWISKSHNRSYGLP
jgi:hypothetical protein